MKLLLIHMKCMAVIGLWSKHRTVYGKAYIFFLILYQCVNVVSISVNFIQCNGRLNCSFENITYQILTVSSIYTMVVFLACEDTYYYACDTLNFLMEEFKTHKYTLRAEIVTRRITVLCIAYYSLGLLHYNVTPLIDYDGCCKRNDSESAFTCGLPTTGWFPFDSTKNPGFAIAYAFQAIAAVLCIKAVTQTSMISCSIIYHVIGHLFMIQDELGSLFERHINQREDKLKQIIRHHYAVMELSDLISKALNKLLLMYTLMLAIIFSVNGFQILRMILTEIELWTIQRYFVVFIGYSMICWFISLVGQKLIDESTRISSCAYNIEWYTESLELQNMIKFIILRANKPLVVKSASITNVSFVSFAKVVSTTYSYLTMMYKVMILNETKQPVT